MDSQKRAFLTLMIPAAVAVHFGFCWNARAAQTQRTQTPSPPAPPAVSLPTPSLPDGAKLDPKAVLKKNQGQIRDDVKKIYTLAGELKDEVEKTDSADVLSLPMIQKAEQIEKLAKQVKNLARGL